MVLGDLNLSNYTILPVEPLNDIKGRMITFSISSRAHITWMMKYVRHWKTFSEPTYTKRRKKAVIVSIHAYLHTTHWETQVPPKKHSPNSGKPFWNNPCVVATCRQVKPHALQSCYGELVTCTWLHSEPSMQDSFLFTKSCESRQILLCLLSSPHGTQCGLSIAYCASAPSLHREFTKSWLCEDFQKAQKQIFNLVQVRSW